jgi:hypothetical protein
VVDGVVRLGRRMQFQDPILAQTNTSRYEVDAVEVGRLN